MRQRRPVHVISTIESFIHDKRSRDYIESSLLSMLKSECLLHSENIKVVSLLLLLPNVLDI